jgi:hypothetical protein
MLFSYMYRMCGPIYYEMNTRLTTTIMRILHSYTYTWWQVSLFKIAMLSIGLAAGSYFAEWVLPFMPALVIVAFITSIYISFVSFTQRGDSASATQEA